MTEQEILQFRTILIDLLKNPTKTVITSEVDELLAKLRRTTKSNIFLNMSLKEVKHNLLSDTPKTICNAKWGIFSLIFASFYALYPLLTSSGLPFFNEDADYSLTFPKLHAESMLSDTIYPPLTLVINKNTLKKVSFANCIFKHAHISVFKNFVNIINELNLKELNISDSSLGVLQEDRWKIFHEGKFKTDTLLCANNFFHQSSNDSFNQFLQIVVNAKVKNLDISHAHPIKLTNEKVKLLITYLPQTCLTTLNIAGLVDLEKLPELIWQELKNSIKISPILALYINCAHVGSFFTPPSYEGRLGELKTLLYNKKSLAADGLKFMSAHALENNSEIYKISRQDQVVCQFKTKDKSPKDITEDVFDLLESAKTTNWLR